MTVIGLKPSTTLNASSNGLILADHHQSRKVIGRHSQSLFQRILVLLDNQSSQRYAQQGADYLFNIVVGGSNDTAQYPASLLIEKPTEI